MLGGRRGIYVTQLSVYTVENLNPFPNIRKTLNSATIKKHVPRHQPPAHHPNGNHMNVTTGDKKVTTYHMRDPQGSVLAVYEHKHGDSDNGTFTLAEQHLYGAGRLGMRKRDLALNTGNANESMTFTIPMIIMIVFIDTESGDIELTGCSNAFSIEPPLPHKGEK